MRNFPHRCYYLDEEDDKKVYDLPSCNICMQFGLRHLPYVMFFEALGMSFYCNANTPLLVTHFHIFQAATKNANLEVFTTRATKNQKTEIEHGMPDNLAFLTENCVLHTKKQDCVKNRCDNILSVIPCAN